MTRAVLFLLIMNGVPMDQATVLKEFQDAQAILRGHFILSSGLHSDTYMQCARVLMDPKRADRLCKALAGKIRQQLGNNVFDMVVSPAMGGVVVGYEMARQLGVESIFCERVDGSFTLRRGFSIPENARILIVEDVITTGKSSLETIDCVKQYGGNVVAEACLVDRSSGQSKELGIPVIALATIEVQSFTADNIPPELKSVPAVKPGSRWLQGKTA